MQVYIFVFVLEFRESSSALYSFPAFGHCGDAENQCKNTKVQAEEEPEKQQQQWDTEWILERSLVDLRM